MRKALVSAIVIIFSASISQAQDSPFVDVTPSPEQIQEAINDYNRIIESRSQGNGASPQSLSLLPRKYYCVSPHKDPYACVTCYVYVGGEVGRALCGAAYGPGAVAFGKCDEEKNRNFCR